jgi:hypothetical protein
MKYNVSMSRWTDEDLAAAVRCSDTWRATLRELGYTATGATFQYIKQRAAELELDTSHFVGRRHARGGRLKGTYHQKDITHYLVSDRAPGINLRERLIVEGLKERRCEWCGLDEWRGLPMPLELDHVNGDKLDNRLCNLRILCPNCHSQTDTYKCKNIKGL